jgi:hypothetical protein
MASYNLKSIAPRTISTEEAAVIRQGLLRAATGIVSSEILGSIDSLQVIALCECGCRSVYFQMPSAHEDRLADGVGYLADGSRVEVLIWAKDENTSSLEIVDHAGAGQLPRAESVCSWEGAGK